LNLKEGEEICNRYIMELEEGEMVCDKCEGTGWMNHHWADLPCEKCNGKGKLDWIENIVGVKVEKSKYEKELEMKMEWKLHRARLLNAMVVPTTIS